MLNLRYDEQDDAVEMLLRDGIVVRTEQLDAGTLVDLDQDGSVVAIELLRPARQWPMEAVLAMPGVTDEDAGIIRALWTQPHAYPFAEPSDSAGSAEPSDSAGSVIRTGALVA